jgi:hypothetical protein
MRRRNEKADKPTPKMKSAAVKIRPPGWDLLESRTEPAKDDASAIARQTHPTSRLGSMNWRHEQAKLTHAASHGNLLACLSND